MLGNRRESAKERALRSELHARGKRFRKGYGPVAGLRCKADVAFTKEKLAVFVDGCFWHRCPEHGSAPKANSHYWGPKLDANVARDRRNDEALQRAGWTVLRMWAHLGTPQMADTVIQTLNALGLDRHEDVCRVDEESALQSLSTSIAGREPGRRQPRNPNTPSPGTPDIQAGTGR